MRYVSNTVVIEKFKLIDRIYILINKNQQKERFFLNFKNDNEIKNLEPSLSNSINSTSSINSSTIIIILLNKMISISSINSNNSIKQLCNFCIMNKYIKIVIYKKMNLANYTYENYIIHLCYQKKLILTYSWMNLFINHGYHSFKAKINSLTSSNSSLLELKSTKKYLDIYKQTIKKNLLVLYLRDFVMRKTILLTMQYHT